MSIKAGLPLSSAVSWAREWQRLNLPAANEAMRRYLHGCANLAMARTPRQALAELHKTQTGLLRHAADTIAKATSLWREQNAELLGIQLHTRAHPSKPVAKL